MGYSGQSLPAGQDATSCLMGWGPHCSTSTPWPGRLGWPVPPPPPALGAQLRTLPPKGMTLHLTHGDSEAREEGLRMCPRQDLLEGLCVQPPGAFSGRGAPSLRGEVVTRPLLPHLRPPPRRRAAGLHHHRLVRALPTVPCGLPCAPRAAHRGGKKPLSGKVAMEACMDAGAACLEGPPFHCSQRVGVAVTADAQKVAVSARRVVC